MTVFQDHLFEEREIYSLSSCAVANLQISIVYINAIWEIGLYEYIHHAIYEAMNTLAEVISDY